MSRRRFVGGSAGRNSRRPCLRFALVAGGGTAGHLEPAIAIAEALVVAGHPHDTIEFVGSKRGQDEGALAGRGFPSTLLGGRGIVRRLRPRDLAADAMALLEMAASAVAAVSIVHRSRPRVVVSVGGYASVPASLAAVLLRIPLVLVNIDAVPGAANRLFGRMARASAVGWPGTPLPRAVVTGTPVRPAISEVSRGGAARATARLALGLPEDVPLVGVFGGSLGARRINAAAVDVVARWGDRSDRAVYHVVGRRDWTADASSPSRPGGPVVRRVPYEDHMELLYAAVDLMVCRAGAMTVAELAATGCPAVLVPLPGAPGDHQTANARVLEQAGAARLLPDPDCDGATLLPLLDELLDDPAGLVAMGRAAAVLGRPDAAEAAARLVEAHARPAPEGSDAAGGGGGGGGPGCGVTDGR